MVTGLSRRDSARETLLAREQIQGVGAEVLSTGDHGEIRLEFTPGELIAMNPESVIARWKRPIGGQGYHANP